MTWRSLRRGRGDEHPHFIGRSVTLFIRRDGLAINTDQIARLIYAHRYIKRNGCKRGVVDRVSRKVEVPHQLPGTASPDWDIGRRDSEITKLTRYRIWTNLWSHTRREITTREEEITRGYPIRVPFRRNGVPVGINIHFIDEAERCTRHPICIDCHRPELQAAFGNPKDTTSRCRKPKAAIFQYPKHRQGVRDSDVFQRYSRLIIIVITTQHGQCACQNE